MLPLMRTTLVLFVAKFSTLLETQQNHPRAASDAPKRVNVWGLSAGRRRLGLSPGAPIRIRLYGNQNIKCLIL